MQLIDNLIFLQEKIDLYLNLNPHHDTWGNILSLPEISPDLDLSSLSSLSSHDNPWDSFEFSSENSLDLDLNPHHPSWGGPELLPGNSPYLEMQFPGAASLIRCDEVPGCHSRLEAIHVYTRLIRTPATADGLGFLMNYKLGFLRV